MYDCLLRITHYTVKGLRLWGSQQWRKHCPAMLSELGRLLQAGRVNDGLYHRDGSSSLPCSGLQMCAEGHEAGKVEELRQLWSQQEVGGCGNVSGQQHAGNPCLPHLSPPSTLSPAPFYTKHIRLYRWSPPGAAQPRPCALDELCDEVLAPARNSTASSSVGQLPQLSGFPALHN